MRKIKFIKTMAITGLFVTFLSGCSSTSGQNSSALKLPWGNTKYDLDLQWKNAKVLENVSCTSFTFEDVMKFIQTAFVIAQVEQVMSAGGEDTQILQNYMLSAALINRANTCIASALELTEALAELDAERQILIGGTSISEEELADHRGYSKSATKAIQEKIKQGEQVSPEQKKSLAIGIATFIGGTHTVVETFEDIVDLTESTVEDVKTASETAKNNDGTFIGWVNTAKEAGNVVASTLLKGGVVSFVSVGMTDVVKNWIATLAALEGFAKINKIEIPQDANTMYDDILKKEAMVEEENIETE